MVEPYYIPSISMYPTLSTSDQIAVEKFSRLWSDPQATTAPPPMPRIGMPAVTLLLT